MEIVSGSFIASDSSLQWIPSGEILKSGWGNGNGVWVVGEELKKVPERMEITWFSYAENKFFTELLQSSIQENRYQDSFLLFQ